MDCKEEISDSDSGIILNSGPDSPTSPVKDLSIHTRAMRLKQQALEDRLEMCFLELKKLCVREAELTGKLPPDYPLLQNEKPPQIRRRVGASFKLDEGLLQEGEESVLHALEADLALQRQIYEASRRLSLEEHLSKPVRKSRLQQCKRELKKMKELQEAVQKHCSNHGCVSRQTCRTSRQRDLSISDDSSLSDAAALDDDFETGPMSPMSPISGGRLPLPTFTLSPRRCAKQTGSSSSLEYERSPVQNTPWKESSLDQPYQKLKKPSSVSSSRSSSPTDTVSDLRLDDIPPAPQFVFKSLAMQNNNFNSAPTTPELPLRRHISQSFRILRPKPDVNKPGLDLSRERTKLPRRRVTDFALAYSVQRLYQCSSEDSSSEHSISSFSSSSSRESTTEATKALPPPYGYHRTLQNNSQSQRSAPKLPPQNNQTVNKPINRQTVTGSCREKSQERMLSEKEKGKMNLPSATPNTNKQQQVDVTSPKRMPPPYSSLARTTSLREYPSHQGRLFLRDVVTNDLKTWHQKNNATEMLQKLQPQEQHKPIKRTPNKEPPAYNQIQSQRQTPQKVILQRAADGTPLQWYEKQDCEIVSQV
ncbi:innate immunity activator protein [Trichomycterus rosablanca]|uniref:innate immunity activator protein n=1 Tax=Trichomycterus rosablanca TaxID=2290929 RepID=UPI002F351EB3